MAHNEPVVGQESRESRRTLPLAVLNRAVRIVQLGGKPDMNPAGILSRSHSDYVEGDSLIDMLKEDLIAERIAIDSYREIILFLGEKDPTSRRVMEEVLAKEEEHAEDISTLLEDLGHMSKDE